MNAAQAYERLQAEVATNLELLARALAGHAEVAARTPDSWSHAGDMANIRNQLANVLAFLGAADDSREAA